MQLTMRSAATRFAALFGIAMLLLGGVCVATVASAPSASAAVTVASAPSASTAVTGYKTCGSTIKTVNLPTLRRGDYGPCVKYAQGLLLAHEVMIGTAQPDGKFGPGTLTGVKNFQLWFEVKGGADGVIGFNTWTALRVPYPSNGP